MKRYENLLLIIGIDLMIIGISLIIVDTTVVYTGTLIFLGVALIVPGLLLASLVYGIKDIPYYLLYFTRTFYMNIRVNKDSKLVFGADNTLSIYNDNDCKTIIFPELPEISKKLSINNIRILLIEFFGFNNIIDIKTEDNTVSLTYKADEHYPLNIDDERLRPWNIIAGLLIAKLYGVEIAINNIRRSGEICTAVYRVLENEPP